MTDIQHFSIFLRGCKQPNFSTFPNGSKSRTNLLEPSFFPFRAAKIHKKFKIQIQNLNLLLKFPNLIKICYLCALKNQYKITKPL